MIASWIGIFFSGVGVVMGMFPSLIACPEARYAIVSFCGLVFLGATAHLACHGWKNARGKCREWQLKRQSLSIELARYSTMIAILLAETDRKNDAMKGQPIPQRVVRKINDRGAVAEYREKILPNILRLLKQAKWLGLCVRSAKKQCVSAETSGDLRLVADQLADLADKAQKKVSGVDP